MCDAIYERTGGLLDIQLYTVGEFSFSGTDMLSVTSDRTVEMTIPSLAYIEGESIVSSIIEWPMLASTNDEIQQVIDILDPYLKEDFGSKGVEMLGWWSNLGLGFYGMGETPQSLADLGGRKIRLYSVPITNILLNYNVVPVSMTVAEVVPALQRGVVEAALTGNVSAYDMSWYDIVDWAFIMNISGAANAIFANIEAMEELPAEVQQIVREEVQNYHDVNIDYNETYTQQCIDGMAEKGVEVVYCSEEDYAEAAELAVAVWDELAATGGERCQEALAEVRAALGK
jgi:TRAP-type C4-dicarboxylate transport system substrate-binding protein